MRIVTVLGGPRTHGNTDRILDWAERAWQEWDHQVERINLAERPVSPCAACLACAESENEPGCVLSDAGHQVLAALVSADAMVFAAPLYMYGVPAQLKALFDRSICLVRHPGAARQRSFVQGKPAALLITCAGPIEGNADLVEESFRRYAEYACLDSRGTYVFPHCTDVAMLPNTHGGHARELARSLVSKR